MLQTPNNIRAVTARDLRNNFKKIADDINDYDTTVIVARPKDKNVDYFSKRIRFMARNFISSRN